MPSRHASSRGSRRSPGPPGSKRTPSTLNPAVSLAATRTATTSAGATVRGPGISCRHSSTKRCACSWKRRCARERASKRCREEASSGAEVGGGRAALETAFNCPVVRPARASSSPRADRGVAGSGPPDGPRTTSAVGDDLLQTTSAAPRRKTPSATNAIR